MYIYFALINAKRRKRNVRGQFLWLVLLFCSPFWSLASNSGFLYGRIASRWMILSRNGRLITLGFGALYGWWGEPPDRPDDVLWDLLPYEDEIGDEWPPVTAKHEQFSFVIKHSDLLSRIVHQDLKMPFRFNITRQHHHWSDKRLQIKIMMYAKVSLLFLEGKSCLFSSHR